MNAGIDATLRNVRAHLERMDSLVATGKTDEGREALEAARREAGILTEMLATVANAWRSDGDLRPPWIIHIVHEGKTLCGQFDLMSGFPHGHTYVHAPNDDADCRECVALSQRHALKK